MNVVFRTLYYVEYILIIRSHCNSEYMFFLFFLSTKVSFLSFKEIHQTCWLCWIKKSVFGGGEHMSPRPYWILHRSVCLNNRLPIKTKRVSPLIKRSGPGVPWSCSMPSVSSLHFVLTGSQRDRQQSPRYCIKGDFSIAAVIRIRFCIDIITVTDTVNTVFFILR